MAKAKPYAAIDWALDQDVSKVQRLLLISLARHADRDGYCYPSQARLAEHAGCTRPTANAQLQALEEAGLIKARRRSRANGSEGSKEYLLLYREGVSWPEVVSAQQTPPLSAHKTGGVRSQDTVGVRSEDRGCLLSGQAYEQTTRRRGQLKSPDEHGAAEDRESLTKEEEVVWPSRLDEIMSRKRQELRERHGMTA